MFIYSKNVSLACFILYSSCVLAAPTLDEVCSITECRSPTTVSVRISEDQASEIKLQKAPYYFQNTANVVSGETLFLEANVVSGKIASLKYVKNNVRPEKTIVVTLSVMESDPSKISTMLEITKPLNEALIYKAMFHAASGNSFKKTSVCPVLSKQSTYENWPFLIFQMALVGFKLLSDSEAKDYGCN